MRILLEDRSGSGKSTIARRLADTLSEEGIPVTGFVTDEIRKRGRRLGFAIERFGGERGVLAHVDLPGPPRVARHGVDHSVLERLAIPALEEATEREVAIIDELGKMELASQPFRDAVCALLDRPVPVVATAQTARHPSPTPSSADPTSQALRVTTAIRDELLQLLAARLGSTQ